MQDPAAVRGPVIAVLHLYRVVVAIEGILSVSGLPSASHPWLAKTVQVTVTDNTLTLTTSPGSTNNKINLIQIRPA